MMRSEEDHDRFSRIYDLVAHSLKGEIAPEDAEELERLVAADPDARRLYLQIIDESLALRVWACGPALSGSALAAGDTPASEGVSPSPTRSVSEETNTEKSESSLALRVSIPQSTFHISRALFHPIALLLVVGFISAGILAYKFSTKPTQPTIAQRPSAEIAEPAAKLVDATDVQWRESFGPGGRLTSGQRLVLTRGSAEILFGSQAKVILDAPAEFEIVTAGACRLSAGRLTAHVPQPARGFQVHTPGGTVTDLGTEFGVYVSTRVDEQEPAEQEQPPTGGPQQDSQQPPVTEVHVFVGKVDVTQAEQPVQVPTKPSEPSPTAHRPSHIVTAGQAVTISDNKVQPLPAADPFKFAIDKLQGKPRTVLLTEDFESYPVGKADKALGAWIIQTGTRKGQGVGIGDFRTTYAEAEAQHLVKEPETIPPAASIAHMLSLVPSAPNPPDTFPRVAHTIDAPQLAGTCRVLVEFLMMPAHASPEPSLAFAAEAGPAPGIEFWRNADAAAPPLRWRPSHSYRIRILLNVVDGRPREAHVERSTWLDTQGWVRDTDYRTPVPKLDWSTPPKFVIFGYPTVSPQTPPGIFSIDNIRIEVISEK